MLNMYNSVYIYFGGLCLDEYFALTASTVVWVIFSQCFKILLSVFKIFKDEGISNNLAMLASTNVTNKVMPKYCTKILV